MSTTVLRKETQQQTHLESLLQLNRDYLRAVNEKNVAWFETNLAADFYNTSPDGALHDRDAFLRKVGHGVGVSDLAAEDVIVRFSGNCAIVHARMTFRSASGNLGEGRYTDVWSNHTGLWLCVAAHALRC
jgi:ketosteroid isomerase-like protein